MVFGVITLLSALTISAIAIYYSVAGLAAIFAAAVVPIIVMGVALEVGKLVTAVWLHRYWDKAVWWMRTYLSLAVLVLMFITSMGIFGFLSKAHIEQTSLSQEQVALIDTLNDKETRAQAKIDRWRGELDRLMKGEDVRVDGLVEKEQEGLDKIYARIKQEKDAFRADAKFEIEQQQLRIKQAQDRRDAEIAAAEKKFEGSLGGTKAYEDAVKKAKDNELGVASRAQAEILKINTKLDQDLANVDAKYAKDVADYNKRINDLRNQANSKTVDIDKRIEELEGFIATEQKSIDDVREEKFGYEKEYRKLEAEVGPIKYIAEFIYGEQADTNLLEAAVRWVIIIIIFVFDPLAVLLLIASQYTFNWYREEKGGSLPPKPEPDPQPEDPEPPFSEEDWEEAHRENEAWDQAQYKELKAEPAISKKKTDQYLLWEEIDPDVDKESDDELVYKKKADQEGTTLGTARSTEEVDPNQLELDFDKEPEEVPGNDLEKWNEWVEAANKAAAEQPEDEDDDDADFWEGLTDEEREAIRIWKAESDKNSLKYQRKLFRKGQIDEYPWMKYLKPQPDFVEDSKFQIMPDLEKELKIGKPVYTEVVETEEELKKKKEILNWMEKEGKEQIKKSKEIEE
jgi:uncharacterized coiled-coil protein SlyX